MLPAPNQSTRSEPKPEPTPTGKGAYDLLSARDYLHIVRPGRLCSARDVRPVLRGRAEPLLGAIQACPESCPLFLGLLGLSLGSLQIAGQGTC